MMFVALLLFSHMVMSGLTPVAILRAYAILSQL